MSAKSDGATTVLIGCESQPSPESSRSLTPPLEVLIGCESQPSPEKPMGCGGKHFQVLIGCESQPSPESKTMEKGIEVES